MKTQEIFSLGYGKIKKFELTSFGLQSVYIKNPNMSQSQIKKSPVYVIEASNDLRRKGQEIKKAYEASLPKEISILDYAKKVAKANKGKIVKKTKSGSVYIAVGELTIRVSDHFVLDRDALNPKFRNDFEVVQRSFDEQTEIFLIN